MAKAKSLDEWGRSKARDRYAVGGEVSSPLEDRKHDIFEAKRALDEQDVGGGTGGEPDNEPLAKHKRHLEMDEYISKRREADI